MKKQKSRKIFYKKKQFAQKYPEPTVGALIFNNSGEIFLMKSHKWNNKYCIPGGHIELGETAEQALKREVKEETGMNIYAIKFLILQEFIYAKGFHKKKHFIFIDYECRAKGTKVKLNSEGQSYVWAKPKKALRMPVHYHSKKTIIEWLEKKK